MDALGDPYSMSGGGLDYGVSGFAYPGNGGGIDYGMSGFGGYGMSDVGSGGSSYSYGGFGDGMLAGGNGFAAGSPLAGPFTGMAPNAQVEQQRPAGPPAASRPQRKAKPRAKTAKAPAPPAR